MIILIIFIILAILISFTIKTKLKLLIGLTITIGLIMIFLIVLHSHIISKMFNKGKTIEEITNIKFEDIKYVSSISYDSEITSEFKERFKDIKLKEHEDIEDIIFKKLFRKYDISQSAAHVKYKCYDKNSKLLYTIDSGYSIEINGSTKKYYK